MNGREIGLDSVAEVALWLDAAAVLSEANREQLLIDLQDIAEQRLEEMSARMGVAVADAAEATFMDKLKALVQRPDARPSERAAFDLMVWCIAGRFGEEGLTDWLRWKILVSYAHLSDDLVSLGRKMAAGRKRGSVGKVRAWVRRYVSRNPKAEAAAAWAAFKLRPPKGCTVYENRVGRYIETAGQPDTGYARFRNILRDEKLLLKD